MLSTSGDQLRSYIHIYIPYLAILLVTFLGWFSNVTTGVKSFFVTSKDRIKFGHVLNHLLMGGLDSLDALMKGIVTWGHP